MIFVIVVPFLLLFFPFSLFLSTLTSYLYVVFCAGVLEQAPELGVRTFAAHWPGHGHREHTALRRLQQTEYHTRRESHTHMGIPACLYTNPTNPQIENRLNLDKITHPKFTVRS